MREQRKRTLPARVVVYYLLAMVLFFQSGYAEVWNKLVAGLDWARRFRDARCRWACSRVPAAITLRAAAAGLAGDGRPAGGGRRAAGRGGAGARVLLGDAAGGGRRDVPGPARPRGERGRVRLPGQRLRAWAVPAGPRRGPGRVRDPGDTWAPSCPAWPPGSSRWPASCSPKLGPGRPAAGRPELPVPRPARRCAGGGGARAVAAPSPTWTCRCWTCWTTARTCPGSPTRPPPARRCRRKGGADPRDIPGHRRARHRVLGDDRGRQRDLRDLHPGHRHHSIPRCCPASRPPRAYASRWQLETCFDELETSIRGGAAVVLRSKSPPMIRQEIYAMLCCYQAIRALISDAAGDAGTRSAAGLLHRRPRGDPAPHQRLRDPFPPQELDQAVGDLAFEITCKRNLVGERPGRRYERKTKRPGGRYKTRNPARPARLTPLTRVVFWLMPAPLNLMPLGQAGMPVPPASACAVPSAQVPH